MPNSIPEKAWSHISCHEPPTGTQNSTVRGMGRTRAILGRTRQGFLKIKER